MTKGVLLVNLGTPDSPSIKNVHHYLVEFLTDARVIDKPWGLRQLLVRLFIVPARVRQSAKSYSHIWMNEGSPLMVYSQKVQKLLQEELGHEFAVELAMRYQKPSIENALKALKNVEHLIVVPLFPQYASATTGSIHQKILEIVSTYQIIPKLTLVDHFADHEDYITAVAEVASEYPLESYDYFLFSFHGLPKRHLTKANPSCSTSMHCCKGSSASNANCYTAQCYRTAYAIAKKLKLNPQNYSVSFQSRLGKEPWTEPFTLDTIKELGLKNKKRVLVFCPSFVSDCLETIYEIGIEYADEFKKHGGEALHFVKSLNDHPSWIKALKALVLGQ